MEIKIQNSQTSDPLIVQVELECNTSREEVLRNVLENSKDVDRDWVKSVPPHSCVALLCGSGPSIKDHVDEIFAHRADGANVFALNGAAKFLTQAGITCDAQIIMDAQEKTLELVGPAYAHYFASQVNPKLFERAPGAILWHATYGNLLVDEIEGFPCRADGYCVIGSATSVGLTSLGLLYALGYRHVKVYGLDSSDHGDQSHVLHQAINDGEPKAQTTYRGVTYTSSFTMKHQAESFAPRAKQWQDLGMRIEVIGKGLLPAMWNEPLTEEEKYAEMWNHPEYRAVAPGESVAGAFLELARPIKGSRVIDFGCGTGRGALHIARSRPDLEVLCLDFTENSRDPEARSLPFHKADLSVASQMRVHGDYGFCTDVLEHIPPASVESVIYNVMDCCSVCCFFQISLVPDSMGGLIGQPLHLSVHPANWWTGTFERLGYRVLWLHDQGDVALFLVSKE